jgi:hypothetical protein
LANRLVPRIQYTKTLEDQNYEEQNPMIEEKIEDDEFRERFNEEMVGEEVTIIN